VTPADKPEMSRILLGLAAIMPNAKVTPEALEVWYGAMREWSIEDFRAAASRLATTCRFMPTPYDFNALLKSGEPTSGEAFASALAHVACGAWRNAQHPDPAIELAVQGMGGWRVLAFTDEDKLHFAEKRFAEHYEATTDKLSTVAALPNLSTWKGKSLGAQSASNLLARVIPG